MIPDAIRQMLGIMEQLRSAYPKKKFTLDGRLVGDLGECLVENVYNLELFEGLKNHHDGKTPDEKYVEIKATMKRSLTIPGDLYLTTILASRFTRMAHLPRFSTDQAL
jgi:hypothetical protein